MPVLHSNLSLLLSIHIKDETWRYVQWSCLDCQTSAMVAAQISQIKPSLFLVGDDFL